MHAARSGSLARIVLSWGQDMEGGAMDYVALFLTIGSFVFCWRLTVWCDHLLRDGGNRR